MSAESDLLPLQLLEAFSAALEANDKDEVRLLVDAYARACIAHATAAKADEIEALRAEVERLTSEVRSLRQQYDERTVYMVVHRGSALACSDSMRAAYSDEHRRAERLAEALRNSADALERLAFAIPAPNVHTPQLATLAIAMRNAAIQRTDAALRDRED